MVTRALVRYPALVSRLASDPGFAEQTARGGSVRWYCDTQKLKQTPGCKVDLSLCRDGMHVFSVSSAPGCAPLEGNCVACVASAVAGRQPILEVNGSDWSALSAESLMMLMQLTYKRISTPFIVCLLACSSQPGDSPTATTTTANTSAGGMAAATSESGGAPPSGQAGSQMPTQMPTSAAGVAQTSVGASGSSAAPSSAATGSAATGGSDTGAAGTPASPDDVAASGDAAGAAGATAAVETAGDGAAGAAAAAGTGAEDPRASCVAGLKTRCGMREMEACSSVETVDIGDLVKAVEIPLGPYGAIMEQNLGQGFEIPEASGEASCDVVAASFGEPADVTANVADLRDVDLKLYTVYRPACMREGETYPVITWGNGTCGQTEGYGPLLRYVASYGYVVVAANSRYTGGNGAMTKALDLAESLNADDSSVYFKRLNMEKVGAMGHSQGGMATITAASDARIDSLIIWNGGSDASKPFLAVSGDHDISDPTAMGLRSAVEASSQPSAWLFYHKVPQTGSVSGHLTLMNQPERVVEVTVAWWDYQLKGDMTARDFFVGDDCGLCNRDEDFEYGAHNLP